MNRTMSKKRLQKIAMIPEENLNPILQISGDGTIVYANRASQPLLQMWRTEVGDRLPEQWCQVVKGVLRSCERRSMNITCRGQTLSVDITPIDQFHYVNLYAIDVTDRKRFEDQLLHDKYYDPLTDLPNFNILEDRLKQMIKFAQRDGKQVTIACLGITDLPEINGTYGHHYGDRLLKRVATRLSDYVPSTVTVARIRGNKVAIVEKDFDAVESVEHRIKSIIESLKAPFVIFDKTLHISVNIGISVCPIDGVSSEDLLGNAELAMYYSRSKGHNVYQFYQEGMNESVSERQDLLNHMRHMDMGRDLELYFQPQVCIKTKRIVAAEALIRWNHSDYGVMSPKSFIHLAEESGLISKIGLWTLREACQSAMMWESIYPGMHVSINLSPKQFAQQGLLQHVEKTLEETGLPAERLELEITENVMFDHAGESVALMRQLKKMGVYVSIDDFGVGYSSLSYLHQMPAHKIKIDASFVTNLFLKKENKEIVVAIIGLAHNLGMKVLAEGVETEEQLVFLEENEWDEVQGYLLGRPLEGDHFKEFLETYRGDRI